MTAFISWVQRARQHPALLILVAIAAVALAAAAPLVYIWLSEDSGSTERRGAGLGGPPPPELVAILNTVPVYPGASIPDLASGVGASTGAEAGAGYAVEDEPEEVMEFYDRVVPALGWQPQGTPVISGTESRGDGSRAVITEWVKDDLRLGIVARTNTKDPSLGHTLVTVHLLDLSPD